MMRSCTIGDDTVRRILILKKHIFGSLSCAFNVFPPSFLKLRKSNSTTLCPLLNGDPITGPFLQVRLSAQESRDGQPMGNPARV